MWRRKIKINRQRIKRRNQKRNRKTNRKRSKYSLKINLRINKLIRSILPWTINQRMKQAFSTLKLSECNGEGVM